MRCLESVYPRSRAQPDQEPSPSSPRCAEPMPEPTDDGESKPTPPDEPLLYGATDLRITLEPAPLGTSDQVREPATMPATRKKNVDSQSAERSSAHCTMAEDELFVDQGLWNQLTCPSPPSFVRALCQLCS